MYFLYFLISFFFVNFILSSLTSFMIYRLLNKNNFTITKTNWRIGYTVSELSQLYDQSKSEQLNIQIRRIIILTRVNTWAWWIYVSIFVIIGILVLLN
jgi:hypothetical protein